MRKINIYYYIIILLYTVLLLFFIIIHNSTGNAFSTPRKNIGDLDC